MKKQNKLNPEERMLQETYLQIYLKNYEQVHRGQKLL